MKSYDEKELDKMRDNEKIEQFKKDLAMSKEVAARQDAGEKLARLKEKLDQASESCEDSSAITGFQKGMDMANKHGTEKVYSEKEVAELIAKEVEEYKRTINAVIDEVDFLRELCLKMAGK